MSRSDDVRVRDRSPLPLIVIGLVAGLFSGLFGVGGGTVILPLLVLWLGFDQRLGAGTSLAAIVPAASIGVISYAVTDAVAWLPALVLAVGAAIGAQVGTALLPRISQQALRWGFVAFLVVVIVGLFLVVPTRGSGFDLGWGSGLGLGGLGLLTGVVSGLIGVGGGVIIVPALMFAFGMSDLVARGTSLLVMIPTAASGLLGNLRRRNVDLRAAAFVGVSACTTTALGAWLATRIDPFVGNLLFAGYLALIAVQMSARALTERRRRR
ncbi:sulfite exporter TauE/SafE family protein [Pseudactinotalea sp. HY158]|uniref:sulfite exporter TauE/SafE family protein n=1 Tax=Pseudactinotalea sp. HY158 TaxID=2654547 RepID=UPI00129C79EA|nr:sulfite exporter TauE/SafE family protein [Pseudactinotalea sp. HY158]QGH68794.1 TSUP family transporter [Pseudactinotalea sp. HY158]